MSYVKKPTWRREVNNTKAVSEVPSKKAVKKPNAREESVPLSSQRDAEEVVMIDTDPRVFGPGVWFAFSSLAARARTPEAIDNFIGTSIPVLINLLCSTCSRHAREHLSIPELHPDRYRNVKDHRGELIGMFIWIYDFHNAVNPRADPPKREMPLDHALAIYSPILDLTKGEIDADYEAAQNATTMHKLHHLTFVDEDNPDVNQLEPVNEPQGKTPPLAVGTSVSANSEGVARPVASPPAKYNALPSLLAKTKPTATEAPSAIKRCTKCGQKPKQ